MRHPFRTLDSAMPATDRLPGTLGPYRLQDRLGEGGMGVVHLAHDPQGRPVAVKVLHPSTTEGDKARLRLAREVDTMRRVRSPFVAEVLDADVTGEFPYVVTRYVTGPTLDEMVRAHGPLSGQGLRLLAYGMAEALTAIHSAGVVHRDLKPGNVMLSDDRPVVIDFGIAQFGDSTRLTQTGLVMGTPGYLAPEVIEGQPSSPASDVHSWGGTMAFAATGRSPYGTGSYEEIFFRIVSGRADLAGVPAPLIPLLHAALARDPARRPSAASLSARSIALDLSAVSPSPVAVGPRPSAVPGAPNPPAPRNHQNLRNGQGPKKARKGRPPQKKLGAAYPPPRPAYPGPKQAAKDVADLLPPVGPAPPVGHAPPAGYAPFSRPPAAPGGAGVAGAPRARDAAAPGPQGPRGRNTMAGLALMVSAVALTVVLPVAGLIVSLTVITLLRAADRAQSTLAVRRSVRGPRASDLLVVVITAPVTVVRALLAEALMAPLAFMAAALTYFAALALTHGRSLPQAGAYAAAAVVVWYGAGPGSHRPRRQVNRMAGAVSRTRLSAAATTLAVWALAASAVLFAVSQAPYYWPAMTPHLPALHGWPFMAPGLPRLHALVSSSANWLFRYFRA
jgi:serine/threonine protein kinase